MTKTMCFDSFSLQLGEYEIAWIDSEIEKTESGTLSSLPLSTTAPPHKSVLVGDLKMADFKQFLSGKGIQVNYFLLLVGQC